MLKSVWSKPGNYESNPTPTPEMIRPTIMAGIPHAQVWKSPPTTKINAPYQIVRRLPMMSPILPTASDETAVRMNRHVSYRMHQLQE